MNNTDFEKITISAIKKIPERFREKMNNIEVCIEEKPKNKQTNILGLYEGVPQTKRFNYGEMIPDKITIFKENIEKAADYSEEKIKKMVEQTVWHEIAHHFGMSEEKVRSLEKKYEK